MLSYTLNIPLMNRITSLDYLRGICAFAIMIYHYIGFAELAKFDSSHFMGRIGVYGVSMFYILSGLTLYIVYNKRFDIGKFYVKRFFRIYPLLWVTITMTLILLSINPPLDTLFYSYSGLFGVLRWWEYIGTGVWSIGNELFFYLIFPVLIMARSKYWITTMSVIFYSVYTWFAFYGLSGGTLAESWRDYVNPLNQVGLFFTGFLIGHLFKTTSINHILSTSLLTASVLAFILYPAEGNTITIVTGINRIAFSLICAVICFSFFKLDLGFNIRPLELLGNISYSVYLLHPIVWFTVSKFIYLQPLFKIGSCVTLTLILSYVVYNYFEVPFMRIASRVSKVID